MLEITGSLVSAAVNATPDPHGLPGSSVAEKLVNGLFFYTLIACLAAMLIGAATWALGARSQNPQYASTGRLATLVAFFGALVAGAAPALINFAQNLGGQVH
jgi:Family of unknown function (DUF6112)